jgi:hypothetical protein
MRIHSHQSFCGYRIERRANLVTTVKTVAIAISSLSRILLPEAGRLGERVLDQREHVACSSGVALAPMIAVDPALHVQFLFATMWIAPSSGATHSLHQGFLNGGLRFSNVIDGPLRRS